MSLEFHYVHGRPMITAKLQKGENRARYFEFLIDSGSDYTLLPESDGILLGIEYAKLPSTITKVEIANLKFIETKKATVSITLGENTFSIPILIAKNGAERLLGRMGIFSKYDITFREERELVIFH